MTQTKLFDTPPPKVIYLPEEFDKCYIDKKWLALAPDRKKQREYIKNLNYDTN